MRRNRFTFVLLLSTLFFSGCGPAPFVKGIRMLATESFANMPGTTLPLPGSSFEANLSGSTGPGNTGQQTYLQGETGAEGIADYPNAVTDCSWFYTFTFNPASSSCPPANGGGYVGPRGAVLEGICVVL